MPEGVQKLRQTCDSCRASKVKCNKQSPVCSRCLVLGTPCNYGVSNRGGRWKNGEKLGVHNRSEDGPEQPVLVPINHWPDINFLDPTTTTSPTPAYTAADYSPINAWQEALESDLYSYETIDIHAAYQPYTMPPTPPSSLLISASSRRGSGWPPQVDTTNDQKYASPTQPQHQTQPQVQEIPPPHLPQPLTSPTTPERRLSTTCFCMVAMLQMLQDLHQTLPVSGTASPQRMDFSTLSFDAVLDINEKATAYCTQTLRCPACQQDDSGDNYTILASLIRKVLSLTEAWVISSSPVISHPPTGGDSTIPASQQHQRRGSGSVVVVNGSDLSQTRSVNSTFISPAEQDDERRIKAQILLIGVRKMEEVLVQMKQAGQGLRADYERLTCASLAASLATRLKNATEMLSELGTAI